MKKVIVNIAVWLLNKVKASDNNVIAEDAYEKGHAAGVEAGLKTGEEVGYRKGYLAGVEQLMKDTTDLDEKEESNLMNYLKKRNIELVSRCKIKFRKFQDGE